jgi:predicted nucleic acid-binding protein
MRRVVIDTNVYVDWINRGQHEELLFQPETVKYLSAVVLMELRAGALSPRDRRLLQRLETAFERAGRILAPSRTVFADAGDALRRLQTDRGYHLGGSHSIANDVLITLSARSIGATVITQNERDYRAIRAVRPFRLLVVKGTTGNA